MRTHRKLAVATATALSLTGGLLTLAAGPAAAATPAKYADDFNGDGYRDYASGWGGEVTVTYGTATGPGPKTVRFTQDSPNIPGKAGDADGYADTFGDQVANADLNRDGYADLAVADRSEKVGTKTGAGAVTILWGAKAGLGAKATRIPAKSGIGFGTALAAGDFNGDGKPDLAVTDVTGTLFVYRGGFSQTGTTGSVSKLEVSPSGAHVLEPSMIVAGRVTKDKATDLYVVGQGYEHDKMVQAAWFVQGGSTIKRGKYTTYNASQVDFGATGVIADFDKNGYGDLAVSDKPYNKGAGSVVVLRGGASGPTTSYRLTQSTPGVATAATKNDRFGWGLSAGDTNRDGYPDLAVGVPEEDSGSVRDAGGVHVLRGGRSGLTGTGSQWFTRATAGVPGSPTDSEMLGLFVRLRDFDRDGDADLLVSGDLYRPGVLLRATAQGITTSGASESELDPAFPQ
ncbi:FG-GAP-like repeat-containing protein [Streptomyces sp. Go40/10]|uniref:FG-GAP and VCBS repeat-containing protein n=1 Tax=Streptomyces sp. Go40/10 TaxID=2825844 RepID=UPI001E491408|nr:FG-GAP and VCBS repeat-containing protein [Streptomyces sp. Go40/10]UFR02731.1 FG-GAP-like repeat-containing protein [Streptomyces sp. Go40/10]